MVCVTLTTFVATLFHACHMHPDFVLWFWQMEHHVIRDSHESKNTHSLLLRQCNHSKMWRKGSVPGALCQCTPAAYGGIDKWWKLIKAAVPNAVTTTKGSMKVNKKIVTFEAFSGGGGSKRTCSTAPQSISNNCLDVTSKAKEKDILNGGAWAN